MTVSQEAMRRLMAYRWPGNVRQLENTVERALAFTQGRSVIDVQDLAPEIQNHSGTVEGPSRGCPRTGSTSSAISRASSCRSSGGRSNAPRATSARPRLLNLKRTTLIEKLKRLEAE